jgi:hypothetical protein
LLYICGFQNTWAISMVFFFFITEFGVLEGPSLFGTNLLWCSCADLQRRGHFIMWTLLISWASYFQQQHEVKKGSWKVGFSNVTNLLVLNSGGSL